MVHGSERTSALASPYAYSLAAQGIAVFVYDKRGTGASGGDYTQNFELLAADAAAAFAHAKTMTRGRISRAGYFGGSQGGWVAPLAATRSDAQFVAIGFGLVASPIEEDREQMISEARALGLDNAALALINRLSAATSRLVLSGFSQGYDELAQVRRELAQQPWSQRISGEYSGEIVRLTDDELRRLGRARFDNVELIWDYDSVAALRRVNVPVLWVLAGEDREAPIETTRAALLQLKKAGKPIDIYLFPNTDHGMTEFVTNADGRAPSHESPTATCACSATGSKGASPVPTVERRSSTEGPADTGYGCLISASTSFVSSVQRLLPAEVARLCRNRFRDAFLHDIQLDADRHLLDRHGRLHLARQVRVVEAVRVAQALVRDQLQELPAKRVALARREVLERHLVAAADARLDAVHLAGKAVRRQPLGHRLRIDESAVDAVGRGSQDSVKLDGIRGHGDLLKT